MNATSLSAIITIIISTAFGLTPALRAADPGDGYLCRGRTTVSSDGGTAAVSVDFSSDPCAGLISPGDAASVRNHGEDWKIGESAAELVPASGKKAILFGTTCYATTPEDLLSRWTSSDEPLSGEVALACLREIHALGARLEKPGGYEFGAVAREFCKEHIVKGRWDAPLITPRQLVQYRRECNAADKSIWPAGAAELLDAAQDRMSAPLQSSCFSCASYSRRLGHELESVKSQQERNLKVWETVFLIETEYDRTVDATFKVSRYEELSYAVLRRKVDLLREFIDIAQRHGRPALDDSASETPWGEYLKLYSERFALDAMVDRIRLAETQARQFLPQYNPSDPRRMRLIRWADLAKDAQACEEAVKHLRSQW